MVDANFGMAALEHALGDSGFGQEFQRGRLLQREVSGATHLAF